MWIVFLAVLLLGFSSPNEVLADQCPAGHTWYSCHATCSAPQESTWGGFCYDPNGSGGPCSATCYYPTPYISPYPTPYQTPDYDYPSPYSSPYSTPYQTPYATPYATPATATPTPTPTPTAQGNPAYVSPPSYQTPPAGGYGTPYGTPAYGTPGYGTPPSGGSAAASAATSIPTAKPNALLRLIGKEKPEEHVLGEETQAESEGDDLIADSSFVPASDSSQGTSFEVTWRKVLLSFVTSYAVFYSSVKFYKKFIRPRRQMLLYNEI